MHREDLPAEPRRLRANEQLMEQLNERMKTRLAEMREEDDEEVDAPFDFFCECSDLDCRLRISVRPRQYEAIHRDPEQFVLVPGHEVPAVERVVDQEGDYLIVRKIA